MRITQRHLMQPLMSPRRNTSPRHWRRIMNLVVYVGWGGNACHFMSVDSTHTRHTHTHPPSPPAYTHTHRHTETQARACARARTHTAQARARAHTHNTRAHGAAHTRRSTRGGPTGRSRSGAQVAKREDSPTDPEEEDHHHPEHLENAPRHLEDRLDCSRLTPW